MQSTHPLSAALVFVYIGVGKCCFASIADVDASTLQNRKSKHCSSKCISSSKAIEEMSREFSKAKHSRSATPQSSTCATDSQFKGVNVAMPTREGNRGAHPISVIRVHVDVGQHCCAPFVDEKPPTTLILRRQNHEHAHSNQSVQESIQGHMYSKVRQSAQTPTLP